MSSELSSFTLDLWSAEPARDEPAATGGLKWYQVRCGDGRPHPVRLAWEDGWLADLQHLARREHGGAVLGRLGDRLGRLLAPTDWPGLVGQIQAARREGRKVRLTLRTNAEELLWLPWEAVPAGQGMATAALLGGPLRFAWASSGSRPAPLEPHPDGGRLLVVAVGDAAARPELRASLRSATSPRDRFFDPERDVLVDPSLPALVQHLDRRAHEGRPVTCLHLLCPVTGGGPGPRVRLGPEQIGDPLTEVPAARLAQALSRYVGPLRAMIVSASGDGAPGAPAAVGLELHRLGLPLVVAPRVCLRPEAAARFADLLHAGLLRRHLPVESAVHEAVAGLERGGMQVDAAAVQVFARAEDPPWSRPLSPRPHRGAGPYDADDAVLFVGREPEVEEVVQAVGALEAEGRPRLLFLAGPPGVGKTSLCLAGVWPALARRRREGWRLGVVRPGPVAAIDAALPVGADGRRLLVVDGLEGLLAPEVDAADRRAFVDRLWRLAASGTSGVTVLATLRLEALGPVAALPVVDMGNTLEPIVYDERHRVFLREPGPMALQRMVREPAAAAGLVVDDALVRALVMEAERVPGSLPALGAALELLWRRRSGVTMRYSTYEELGGLRGALDALGEAAWGALPDEAHQQALRAVLQGIVLLPDGEAPRARRLPLAAVESGPAGATARRVVELCVERGLLELLPGPAGPELALASDRLIDGWRRLLALVKPAAPAPAAPAVSPAAAPRRRRWPVAAALLVVVLCGVLGGVAAIRAHQRGQAQGRFEAAVRALNDPTSAAVLLRQIPPALRPGGWAEAANEALQGAQASVVLPHPAAPTALRFDPDGARLLTVASGRLRLQPVGAAAVAPVDALGGVPLDGNVVDAAFTPSGELVVVLRTGEVLRFPPDGAAPAVLSEAAGEGDVVVSFSADGGVALVARRSGWKVVSAAAGELRRGTLPANAQGRVEGLCCAAVSDDGARWALGTDGGRIFEWDHRRERPLVHTLEGLQRVVMNGAGTHLLALGGGGMRIFDLLRGFGSTRTPAQVRVAAADFAQGGRAVVVDYEELGVGDGAGHHVRLVSLEKRRDQLVSPALDGPGTGVVGAPDGRVFRARPDGAIHELRAGSGELLRALAGHEAKVGRLRLSRDGRWLASASTDGEVRLWDTRVDGSALRHPAGPGLDKDAALVLGPDGAQVAGRARDGAVRAAPAVAGAGDGAVRGAVPSDLDRLWVDPEGARVVGRTGSGGLYLWGPRVWVRTLPGVLAVDAMATRALAPAPGGGLLLVPLTDPGAAPERRFEAISGARLAAFEPEGSRFAVVDDSGRLQLYDAVTGVLEQGVALPEAEGALCVGAGGARVGVGLPDGDFAVWTPGGALLRLGPAGGAVRACAFARGAERLVLQTDSAATAWDLSGPAPRALLQAPARPPALGPTARLSPLGDTLITLDAAGELRRWLLDPDDLHRRLWAATPTCRVRGEEPLDLGRWCACEACAGRSPERCGGRLSDPLRIDLDLHPALCPK